MSYEYKLHNSVDSNNTMETTQARRCLLPQLYGASTISPLGEIDDEKLHSACSCDSVFVNNEQDNTVVSSVTAGSYTLLSEPNNVEMGNVGKYNKPSFSIFDASTFDHYNIGLARSGTSRSQSAVGVGYGTTKHDVGTPPRARLIGIGACSAVRSASQQHSE